MIVSGTEYYEMTLKPNFRFEIIQSIDLMSFAFIYPDWSTTVPQSSQCWSCHCRIFKVRSLCMHHPLNTFRRSYYDHHKLHQEFQIYHNLIRKNSYFCVKTRFHHRWIWLKVMFRLGSFLTRLKNFSLGRLILILSILLGWCLFWALFWCFKFWLRSNFLAFESAFTNLWSIIITPRLMSRDSQRFYHFHSLYSIIKKDMAYIWRSSNFVRQLWWFIQIWWFIDECSEIF